jgi:hypothetical protein
VGGRMLRMANRMMYAPREKREARQEAPDRRMMSKKPSLAERLM